MNGPNTLGQTVLGAERAMLAEDTKRVNETALRKLLTSLSYHRPSDEGQRKIGEFRLAVQTFAEQLVDLVPPSRERSIAITELESLSHWAVKAIVMGDVAATVLPAGQ